MIEPHTAIIDRTDPRATADRLGLIETMAILDGHVRRLSRHLDRLIHSCERLALDCPPRKTLDAECQSFAKQAALFIHSPRAVLRLTITRDAPDASTATRTYTLRPWPHYPDAWHDTGVHIRTCTHRLTPQPPTLAGLKHTDRRDYDLARTEWTDPTIAEGLLLDTADRVICGTRTNLFIASRGTLITPPITHCGIAGTTRATIIDLARANTIPVFEATLTREDLLTADEVFLTNALINIWPVIRIDGHAIAAGSITRHLQRELTHAC